MNALLRPLPVFAITTCLLCFGCAGYNESSFGPGSRVAVGPTSSPSSMLSPVRFSLDRAQFARGDAIEIREVLTSSPRPRIGDTVLVRGQYRLSSAPSASLALYMTTRGPSGWTPSSPTQRCSVMQGTGEFELSTVLSDEGDLHVSFYPSRGGSVMGGVYFYPKGM
jgi:hypothetical protein